MERPAPFLEGEFYHVYNRGIDKRKIFFSDSDWKHFQRLLYIRNSSSKHIKPTRVQGLPLDSIDRGDTLVDVVAYTMMPNHFHLLLREKQQDGIATFMHKFLTAFSMYVNIKYERSGPLMCRPYRAKHVDNDAYLRWLFAYIHLNPLEIERGELEVGTKENVHDVQNILNRYPYGSYVDYFGPKRDQSAILNKEVLPIAVQDMEDPVNLLGEYHRGSNVQGEPLDIGSK